MNSNLDTVVSEDTLKKYIGDEVVIPDNITSNHLEHLFNQTPIEIYYWSFLNPPYERKFYTIYYLPLTKQYFMKIHSGHVTAKYYRFNSKDSNSDIKNLYPEWKEDWYNQVPSLQEFLKKHSDVDRQVKISYSERYDEFVAEIFFIDKENILTFSEGGVSPEDAFFQTYISMKSKIL